MLPITLADVIRARRILAPILQPTPLQRHPLLEESIGGASRSVHQIGGSLSSLTTCCTSMRAVARNSSTTGLSKVNASPASAL